MVVAPLRVTQYFIFNQKFILDFIAPFCQRKGPSFGFSVISLTCIGLRGVCFRIQISSFSKHIVSVTQILPGIAKTFIAHSQPQQILFHTFIYLGNLWRRQHRTLTTEWAETICQTLKMLSLTKLICKYSLLFSKNEESLLNNLNP